MERMLVTQVLNELKLIGNRIDRTLDNAQFIASAKTSGKNVTPSKSKEDFEKEAKGSLDSANDLIDRRERMKAALIQSNAETKAEICGRVLSIAKIIDMKDSMGYYRKLLTKMKAQYSLAVSQMERSNAKLEDQIDGIVKQNFSKEAKVSESDYESIAIPVRRANECSLVDPLKLKNEMERLERFIEEFDSNVNTVLQTSNCVTYIEF